MLDIETAGSVGITFITDRLQDIICDVFDESVPAAGERRGGYPEKFACDIYVQPVIIDEDLMSDFAEVNKQC